LLVVPNAAVAAGGHGFSVRVHGFYAVTFLLLVTVLYVVLRKTVVQAFRRRSEQVAQRIEDARSSAEKADHRCLAARKRESCLDDEKVSTRARVDDDCRVEVEKIENATARELEGIRVHLQKTAAMERMRRQRDRQRWMLQQALDRVRTDLMSQRDALPHGELVDAFVQRLRMQEGTRSGSK
jgi:F0F1-type ATP synthase membrane subunit b/b'